MIDFIFNFFFESFLLQSWISDIKKLFNLSFSGFALRKFIWKIFRNLCWLNILLSDFGKNRGRHSRALSFPLHHIQNDAWRSFWLLFWLSITSLFSIRSKVRKGKFSFRGSNRFGVNTWQVQKYCVNNLIYKPAFDNLDRNIVGSWIHSDADLFMNRNIKSRPLQGEFIRFSYLILVDKNFHKVLLVFNGQSSVFFRHRLERLIVAETGVLNLRKSNIIIFDKPFSSLLWDLIFFDV